MADQKHPYMYPDLFQGLCKIPGKYHIQLKNDAMPFALSTPRSVALPLQPKVKSELQLWNNWIFSKVDKPTDRCARMVVVPKQDGKVCICIDLTKLNESVCTRRDTSFHMSITPLLNSEEPRSSRSLMPIRASGRLSSQKNLHFSPLSSRLLGDSASIAFQLGYNLDPEVFSKVNVGDPVRPRRSYLHDG